MHSKETVSATVTRGSESWAYLYMMLGFALAIGGTIIQMITPLVFPWNLLTYLAFGAGTVWLLICNGSFQNKLITWKLGYEGKAR